MFNLGHKRYTFRNVRSIAPRCPRDPSIVELGWLEYIWLVSIQDQSGEEEDLLEKRVHHNIWKTYQYSVE